MTCPKKGGSNEQRRPDLYDCPGVVPAPHHPLQRLIIQGQIKNRCRQRFFYITIFGAAPESGRSTNAPHLFARCIVTSSMISSQPALK